MSNEQKGMVNGNGNGASSGNGSRAMVTGPQARLNNIKALFEKSKGSIAEVLPKHLTPERLIKIATSAASRNPDLLACSPESLLLAVVQAGTLGLEPSTPLGHAYLVPFNNKHTKKKEATLIIGYRGLLQLAFQSGAVSAVYAHVVHERDEFEIEYGTSKRIFHRPFLQGDPGDVIGFYAVAKFKHGGDPDFEFMSKGEVDAIRANAQGKDSDAWINHYEEMGKKTALRRLSKTLPMSSEKFERAVAIDDAHATGKAPDYSDVIDVVGMDAEMVDPETGEVTAARGSDPGVSRADAMAERLATKATGNAS